MKKTLLTVLVFSTLFAIAAVDELEKNFTTPPPSARPWVYWMIMDGNLTREGITADLEAMARAGIGGAIILEVNIGIPRGQVEFMSPEWRELMKYAIHEAERLGLEVALPAGPGWCGSGGPWVKPEKSMQHLVASEIQVTGPMRFDAPLPKPQPRTPFFGEGTLTPELHKIWKEFYRDVIVLAFPTPEGNYRIPDVDEKALYYRPPYSSQPGVKPFLTADNSVLPLEQCIPRDKVVELKLTGDRLVWDVPPGRWTIMRFGRTLTGQTTRPAPMPGLGFESDKFDKTAVDEHFESFIGALLKTVGKPKNTGRGLTTLHFDSWEMSSQNWSERFREEFQRRRGYDSSRFLPVMTGRVVDSVEVSERFLWDLRRTAQELVIENHALRLKELARQNGMILSIEPYDLNPAGDLALGNVADVPMCEFWSKGYGFNTEFSVFEAVSVAHTMGRKIVGAESFTSHADAWRQHPGSMKQQGDWALCAGVNRFVFHRYQHQPWLGRFPGMTFGPYGVHWERTQTWWEMSSAYHTYLARCQALLRHGLPVADILYLDAEGAPNVFRPPASATLKGFPDRRGYNFDGCEPGTLIKYASVKDGRIVFPDGMSYRLLVLPQLDTMTPALLRKIAQLVKDGATVVGVPPQRSPSLENYPECDNEVRRLAAEIWQNKNVILDKSAEIRSGKKENPLVAAKWIWHDEGKPGLNVPACKRYFRRELEVTGAVASATATITADNSFTLFINNHEAGSGSNFHQPEMIDITSLLNPGRNVISVIAENGGDDPNPAGLICALEIKFQDGKKMIVVSDKQWYSAITPDGEFHPVRELGLWNMQPWNLSSPSPKFPEIYPNYDTTAQILARMGVLPDFESDADLRYTHRHSKDAEIYFVGNRTDEPVSARCLFRVTGLQPELWNPMTGEKRVLPEFQEQNGRIMVPLRFEPSESYFVVFHKRANPAAVDSTAKNFLALRTNSIIETTWEVSFDPKWGGPAKPVTFAKLEDWSKRPEDGIKYYSGTAVYRTTFQLNIRNPKSRIFLDLGRVEVMARVKVNDKDCGIVWTKPYRVDISRAARNGDNNLEIEIVNLWINRMIGDEQLPEDSERSRSGVIKSFPNWLTSGKPSPTGRYTFTTWRLWKKDAPLVPSGLLGPVCIIEEIQ
jgi:hypothetical protein